MSQNKIIGLTGSISTGKTQVSNYLRDRGEKVIDADLIAREVVDLGPVKEIMRELMENSVDLNVKLSVDMNTGKNLYESK